MPDLGPTGVAALTAFVSTLAATPVRYLIDRRLNRDKKELEEALARRRELSGLARQYRGRLVEEGDALHRRLQDLWRFEDRGWLDAGGDYDPTGERRPFFFTTVYRFASFAALATAFERGAMFLDAENAEPSDLALLRWVKALRWAITDTRLFDGLGYEFGSGRDHLFRDLHRSSAERLLRGSDDNPTELHYAEFLQVLSDGDDLLHLLRFFDGLQPDEPRLRWDRLVAFDLLLAGLLGTCGYREQRSSDAELAQVVAELRHPEVAANLASWLPLLGLRDEPEGKRLARALRG